MIDYRLWENSKYVSKQLDKIGLMLSTTLVNAGLTNFKRIQASRPRELEMVDIKQILLIINIILKGFCSLKICRL